MNYDLNWLQNWANSQVYTDSGTASWLVISQVIPNFPNHTLTMGPTGDGKYGITLTGAIIDGTTVYISPAA